MYKFSEFTPEHLIELLRAGHLTEFIDDLIKSFHEFDFGVQFELINFIRDKKPDFSLKNLAEVLEISQDDARKIVSGPSRIVPFVVVKGETGEIAKMLVIRDTSSIITNFSSVLEKLEVIARFCGCKFAVIFSTPFLGESFMLPLATALCVENFPDDVVFTGKIDEKGMIYEVDYIKEKRKLVHDAGFRLVSPIEVENVAYIKRWLDAPKVTLPVFITSSTGEHALAEYRNFAKSVCENYESLSAALNHIFGVQEENLLIRTAQLTDSESWLKAIDRFYGTISWLYGKFGSKADFIIGLKGPVSLSLGLGMVFGSQTPFTFCHYENLQYMPIRVNDVRYLKERTTEYPLIETSLKEGKKEEIAIILSLAHHEPLADSLRFISENFGDIFVLTVGYRQKGNIPVEEQLEIARQIAGYIQDLRAKYSFNRFYFFLSAPLSIAFMLGVAFGYYSDGAVFQYRRDISTYQKVYELSDIRKIREC
ncbi:MAG: SAVED domain-containing protein [candidate division WOR-3 bacterium]